MNALDFLVGREAGGEAADLADAAGGADPLGEDEGLVGGGGAVVDLALL
ncbi:hypothetical protein [Streptomyces noursei]|nr:hypothetical protein [Streptomyces noursei]